MRLLATIRRASLFGLTLLVACDNSSSPSQGGNAPNDTSSAPGSTQPDTSSGAQTPQCAGLPGRIHPATIRTLVESIPAAQQSKLREAIAKEDDSLFPDPESFPEYLESNAITSVTIDTPAAGCPSTHTLLFAAHTFEKSTEVNDDLIAVTPCLGLSANPDPAYWHCAGLPLVDTYNQQNCIDPAFKGLGCAPKTQAGLSIVVDKNPCFEQAKQANQPIHAATKAAMAKLGHTQGLVEKPYAIQKCLGEKGKTWLVGPQSEVQSGGTPVSCHGFEVRPASNELECYELYPEDDPSIPVACGPLWVCLARP